MDNKDNCMFSIIVPVYNVEDYLEECVRSVLNQECTDFEIILVDDGSKDSSSAICDRFQKEYGCVKAFHKENGGLSSARNYGIRKATGKYIYFLDSDDYILTDALNTFLTYINKYDYPEIVSENGMCVYENGAIRRVENYEGGESFGKVDGRTALLRFLEGVPHFSACAKLYSREMWINKGFKFEEGITSEDLELTYKVVYEAKSIVMTGESYYVYRLNRDGSIMNKYKEKNIRDMFIVFDSWETYFQKKKCEKAVIKGMRRLLGDIYYNFVLSKLNEVETDNLHRLCTDTEAYLSYAGYGGRKYIIVLVKIFGIEGILKEFRWIERFEYIKYLIRRKVARE